MKNHFAYNTIVVASYIAALYGGLTTRYCKLLAIGYLAIWN